MSITSKTNLLSCYARMKPIPIQLRFRIHINMKALVSRHLQHHCINSGQQSLRQFLRSMFKLHLQHTRPSVPRQIELQSLEQLGPRVGQPVRPWLTVVGVAAEARYQGLGEATAPAPDIYVSLLQFIFRPPLTVNFSSRPSCGKVSCVCDKPIAAKIVACRSCTVTTSSIDL